GEADAEVVSLHAMIAVALHARRLRLDAREQAALRITRDDVWTDLRKRRGREREDAVERFAILAVWLAAHDVFYARLRHEIALVSGVHENFRREHTSAFHDDARDADTLVR